jgi:hypothetical protein
MSQLTSHEALHLTASFAFTAERMRSAAVDEVARRATLCEIASRVAFLRAHLIAKDEQVRPMFGMSRRTAAFATA